MSCGPLEGRLSRYAPSGPPPEFRHRLLETVSGRVRRRRRTIRFAVLVLAMLISGMLINHQAERVYEDAMQVAGGASHRQVYRGVAAASILSINAPGAKAVLQWNGGPYE